MDESNRRHHATSIGNGANIYFLFSCLVQSVDVARSGVMFLAVFHWSAIDPNFVCLPLPDCVFLPGNLLCGATELSHPNLSRIEGRIRTTEFRHGRENEKD